MASALRPFFLRRTKEGVLTELPAKSEQVVACELEGSERREYDKLREHYRGALLARADEEGVERIALHVLEALLRLRQAACHPGLIDPGRASERSAKLDALESMLDEVCDSGHKALVFSQFTSFLAIVRHRLDAAGRTYEYLDGRTRKREDKVRRFQEDSGCPLFLISLKAGGFGLNLTAADYIFVLDPWWNSDRMHITHDLRATPPDSFSTKDAYTANDIRMNVKPDTTVKATQYDRYEDRYDRNADKNRPGTPDESFSTSDPYVAKPLDAAAMRKSVALTWMERDFVSQALSGSRFEVDSSQLALQKEISGRHRDFAQTMIADHGALNRDLERIAQRKGVNVSADVDSKHNLLMAELRDLDGHAFEQRYHDIQVAGHEQMIQLLENASRDCDDPELKALAQKALSTVRHHLELLKDIDVPRADSKDSDSSANSDQ